MVETFEDISKPAPQTLLAGFTRKRMPLCLGVAAAAHLVLIALTSIAFIFGVRGRQTTEPVPANETNTVGTADTSGAPAANAAGSEDASGQDEASMLEKHRDAPVVKAITEQAAPEDIPTEPDDLGLSVEDTNRF